jgi:Phosphodiester glycosidase
VATRLSARPVAKISSLAGTPGLVAALNGDFSAYTTPTAYRNSGILVRKRRIYNFGWGGNGVGYLPNGNFVMGHPTAHATQLLLPNNQAATIGAWNAPPGRPDQVGAYVIPGAKLTVPAGYAAFRVGTTQFRKMLHGTKSMTNPQGSGVQETVTGFTFSDPAALPTTNTVPITGSYPAGTVVTVPTGGALLVTNATGLAGVGLANLAARATSTVKVTGDAQGWGSVRDVMGGKPQLVTTGVAVSTKPAPVNDWQWTCGGGCWRPALVRSNTGQGWLIVAGATDGTGITMPTWAKMLKQLGAKDAMGFDNNGSAEMFHPGAAPIDAYGYERSLPTATALTYH